MTKITLKAAAGVCLVLTTACSAQRSTYTLGVAPALRVAPTSTRAAQVTPLERAQAIVNERGLCLDVEGGESRDGARVINWSCHGGHNQQWQLFSDGTIRGRDGRCLDIAHDPAGRVHMWTCHGGENQRWEAKSDGTLRGADERCLHSASEGVEGSPLVARRCEGHATQRFATRSF